MNDISGKMLSYICQSGADHHCLTCADEAVAVKVISIDQEAGLALCSLWLGANPIGEASSPLQFGVSTGMMPSCSGKLASPTSSTSQLEGIDITLVEDVAVGDILLAHAGVAIAHQQKEQMHGH